METWKTRKREVILTHSKYLTVEAHEIELPDGQIIEDWAWLKTPNYINVAAQTEQGQYLCFRQTKYAIEGTALAPVGGYIEPDEAPLEAAKRELLEETGYQAPDWVFLNAYAVDGNRGAGNAHFFLARNARQVAEINADDLEEQTLLLLSKNEVLAALQSGEFKVLPWASIMALALLHS